MCDAIYRERLSELHQCADKLVGDDLTRAQRSEMPVSLVLDVVQCQSESRQVMEEGESLLEEVLADDSATFATRNEIRTWVKHFLDN